MGNIQNNMNDAIFHAALISSVQRRQQEATRMTDELEKQIRALENERVRLQDMGYQTNNIDQKLTLLYREHNEKRRKNFLEQAKRHRRNCIIGTIFTILSVVTAVVLLAFLGNVENLTAQGFTCFDFQSWCAVQEYASSYYVDGELHLLTAMKDVKTWLHFGLAGCATIFLIFGIVGVVESRMTKKLKKSAEEDYWSGR